MSQSICDVVFVLMEDGMAGAEMLKGFHRQAEKQAKHLKRLHAAWRNSPRGKMTQAANNALRQMYSLAMRAYVDEKEFRRADALHHLSEARKAVPDLDDELRVCGGWLWVAPGPDDFEAIKLHTWMFMDTLQLMLNLEVRLFGKDLPPPAVDPQSKGRLRLAFWV